MADGTIPLVVGTHAVLGEGARFHRLALAVDEVLDRLVLNRQLVPGDVREAAPHGVGGDGGEAAEQAAQGGGVGQGQALARPLGGDDRDALGLQRARQQAERVGVVVDRQVAELAGKLETASALAKSAWPNPPDM